MHSGGECTTWIARAVHDLFDTDQPEAGIDRIPGAGFTERAQGFPITNWPGRGAKAYVSPMTHKGPEHIRRSDFGA